MLASVSVLVFGQVQNATVVKRIKINEYSIQTGLFGGSPAISTLADFNILAPNSVLLNSNLIPDPATYYPYYYQRGPNSMFSAMLGFQFSDKQKTHYNKNIQLRVGVTYFNNSVLSGGLYNSERVPFDTLTSSQTGSLTFIDSIITKGLNMNYSSEQLRLDGTLIIRTNPDARFSLYSGIGLSAGFSFNAKTTIRYITNYQIVHRDPNGYTEHKKSFSGDSEYEVITNKNNFGFSAYIPLGINLKLGHKTEFWKKVNLFYEIRPSINVTYIPELRTVTNSFVHFGGGFRILL
jgi:hypothetical protein